MKVLMITPYLPYPLHSGGQIRSYNLLKNLSSEHEITLVAFVKRKVPADIEEVKKYCQKVQVVTRSQAFSIRNVLLAALTPYPLLVTIYLSPALRKLLRAELAATKYDLIHAETFYVMPNLPTTQVPVLLVEQTIEYLVYDHFAQMLKNPLLRQILSFDVAKIKFWESHYWRKADKVVAMSEADLKRMQTLVANLPCEIVPNGIDTQFFAKVEHQVKEKTVIFVGNFSWLQNREAVDFLIRRVWPEIAQKFDDVKLLIVGRNPTPSIYRLCQDKRIRLVGDIDDIRKAYAAASVLVAPIFGPGGTRYKILEAMASAVPVVTTPLGIEGIPAKSGREVLIGETASGLAKAAVKVLEDDNFAQNLAENARRLVNSKFSWQVISKQLSRLYQEVASGKN